MAKLMLIADYVVVAAKVPRKVKELMDALGIKPAPITPLPRLFLLRRLFLKGLRETLKSSARSWPA